MTPVMLLGLDGVVNALTRMHHLVPGDESTRVVPRGLLKVWPDRTWLDSTYTHERETRPLLWSARVVERLTGLHESGRVEIRWHTTWQHEAPKVGAGVFALPDLPVAEAPEYAEHAASDARLRARLLCEGKPSWWKYPAAERVLLDEKRPLIWVDDDLDGELGTLARARMGSWAPFLSVCPNQSHGLTATHFKNIDTFIDNLGKAD